MRPRHIALLLIVLYAAVFRLALLDRVFHYDPEGTGAFYGVLARNTLRYDWRETFGMPVLTVGRSDGASPLFYVAHPPTVPLLIAASYAAFGIGEWQTRLPTALATLATILALYGVVRRRGSVSAALLTAALFAAMPMTLYYGGQPEVVWMPLLLFAVLAIDAYLVLHSGPTARRLLYLLLMVGLAAACDWPAFLLVPLFVLHFGWTRPWADWRWILGLGAGAVLLFAALYAYITLATGSSWDWMIGRVLTRTGMGKGSASYALVDWWRMAARYNLERHTLPILLLAAGWLATTGLRRSAPSEPVTPLARMLLAWGVFHVAVGREGVFVHEWWWSPLTPGLSMAAAWMLDRLVSPGVERGGAPPRRLAVRASLLAVALAAWGAWTAVSIHRELRSAGTDGGKLTPPELGRAIQAAAPALDEVVLLAWTTLDPQTWYYGDRPLKGSIWTVADLERRLGDGRVDLMFGYEQPWAAEASAILVPEVVADEFAPLLRHLSARYQQMELPPEIAEKFRAFRVR